MSDLVERLNDAAPGGKNRSFTSLEQHEALHAEAAAELTRLRALNAELVEALQWYVDNDETNEGDAPMPEYNGRTWDELNAFWIAGRNRAIDLLTRAGGSHG